MNDEKIIAGIEFGGTKTIAIIASGQKILDEFQIATTKPKEVLFELISWLKERQTRFNFSSIGIASFGPLCLDIKSQYYGFITTTPKPYWGMIDVLGAFREAFNPPIAIDTDVNGAALAEYYWGASIGTNCSVYITIGTGIGGGIIVNGAPIHGFSHPEMGHAKIRRNYQTEFKGVCPFHGDCFEGIASGPAISERTGIDAKNIGPEHEIWNYLGDEIAEFLTNIILTLSPQKIAIGGGVMNNRPDLFLRIHKSCHEKLNGYIHGLDLKEISRIIVAPVLGEKAGPLGAIAIGLKAVA